MVAEKGTLFIVSTPIGNLGDLSARALETLRTADAILAEDTRHTRALLAHFDIHTPLESYHEHNEAATTPSLVGRLQIGARLALVSDAGTPLLSDPGSRLVEAAVAAGIAVVPVPGASALLSALVGAALPADRFTFFGFVPRKGPERRALLADVASLRHAAVLYEAPSRVGDTLADLAAAGAGDRAAVVARELTKQFEEFCRGTVGELAARFADAPPRGEVVIVVQGGEAPPLDEEALRAKAAALRADGLSARDVVRVLMEDAGAPRNLAYRLAHD
ncbi:MAG: 16S rRNA (cytidine(1402)-2'-O)-methyltransferase [Gemmatimonadetes bacterium]|nr:16S rRNA (cytidine(1402)-2'-O)-methyltransferase [Gemmatimonadota bacterium]